MTAGKGNLDWLLREIFREYHESGDVSIFWDFVRELQDFDRESFLEHLFATALQYRDWKLADECIAAGFAIAQRSEEISNSGPIWGVLMNMGDCPDVVEWLIRRGANLEQRNASGCTPLIGAAGQGWKQTVEVLIANGADIDASTVIDDGMTALMAAAIHGRETVVRQLLDHGADPFLKDRWGNDAVHLAEQHGHDLIAHVIRTRTQHK
jgi:hypothetical protein